MTYLNFLNDRASVRTFDPNYEISDREIQEMMQSAANAPSSNNFQPWKIIAVKHKEKQDVLRTFAYGQNQVKDASVVFIIFGDKTLYDADKLMDFNVQLGTITEADRSSKMTHISTYLNLHPEDIGIEGLKFDSGLFSMNLMHVIRAFGYDSVPMRGVDFDNIKNYLDVPANYEAMLLLPVGKALKPGYPHVRYPLDELFTLIK